MPPLRTLLPLLACLCALGGAAMPAAALAQAAATPEAQAEPPAPAAPAEDPDEPAPYDADMARLANTLGALHYLRNLCGDDGTAWRDEMAALIAEGRYEGERRRRLEAAFNDGYRAFSATYASCTPRAAEAAETYRRDGAALAAGLYARFRG